MLDKILFWRRPPIGVIELHGTLSSREGALNLKSIGPLIERAFRSVAKNDAVILDINSPGGSPVQSDLIAGLIRKRAEKVGAKVHAVIQDVGASGGYWIACAADEIHANPMSVVGSIGVIGGGFGFTELLQRLGVERRLYTAGRNKARLDPFSPERPEDVEFVKHLLDDLHERFKSWVRQRRGGRLKDDEPTVFDGSFMLGDRALALGLIDGFADVETIARGIAGERARTRTFRQRRRGLLRRLPRLIVNAALDAIEERHNTIRLGM